MTNFFNVGIFKEGTKLFDEFLSFLLIGRERQVIALVVFPAKSNPNQLRLQGFEAGGFCIEAHTFLCV